MELGTILLYTLRFLQVVFIPWVSPSKILYLFFSTQMRHFLRILSPHPCSPIPLVHAASSGYLLPIIFNIISTLSQ